MSRHRFLADLSDLRSVSGAEVPDVLIVGGYAVPEEAVSALTDAVFSAKAALCGNGSIPVKWNLKDVSRALQSHGLQDKQSALLAAADPLRSSLLELLRVHGCTLFASILQGYSNRRQVLGKTRPDLIRYSFCNLLQRFGQFARAGASSGGRLYLDWPERNLPQPFTSEYLEAWRDGPGYQIPPLGVLGFEPALSFGVTDFDPLLQLADLVVGVSRSLVRHAQGEVGESDFGVQQFREAIPAFYQSPTGLLRGWGLVLSPKDSGLALEIVRAGARLKAGSA